ncbi:unnamed protein product [Meloidogyne enterolobii]|uniref:Uncharacterized protein n=1 Tax=Meloidogyne enterolobii TaxID=390850 RepID=A0ACB0ZXY5_MELEN
MLLPFLSFKPGNFYLNCFKNFFLIFIVVEGEIQVLNRLLGLGLENTLKWEGKSKSRVIQ